MSLIVALLVATLTGLLGMPSLIGFMRRRGYIRRYQIIRIESREEGHSQEIPDMGGVMVILTTILGYLAAHLISQKGPTASGILVLGLMAGSGLIGFLDEFIKLYMRRSLGLRTQAATVGVGIIGVIFAANALHFRNAAGLTPASTRISFDHDLGPSLEFIICVCWLVLLIFCATNGVKFADTIDGLAAGLVALFLVAYVFIGVTESKLACGRGVSGFCYVVRDPQDIAVLAAALLGACSGFLWWNAAPARINLGTTGDFALGAAMAGLAITSRTELLGAVLAGLNGMLILSVVIDKYTHALSHRHVLREVPLQNHYQLAGWPDSTILMRFLLFEGLCLCIGLIIFFARPGLL